MKHPTNCTGCPTCDTLLAEVQDAQARRDVVALSRLHTKLTERHRAQLAATRAARDFTPSDPYAAGIAVLRAAAKPRASYPTLTKPALPLDARGVPDPYAAGLAKMREASR